MGLSLHCHRAGDSSKLGPATPMHAVPVLSHQCMAGVEQEQLQGWDVLGWSIAALAMSVTLGPGF